MLVDNAVYYIAFSGTDNVYSEKLSSQMLFREKPLFSYASSYHSCILNITNAPENGMYFAFGEVGMHLFWFGDRVLHCSSDWASTHHVVEEHLELLVCGNSPLNSQVYRYESLY